VTHPWRELGEPDPRLLPNPQVIRRAGRGDSPDFEVRLRLTGQCGSPHDSCAGAPVILIYGAGEAGQEDRLVYEDLLRGSFWQASGYPCAEGCGGRHPPRSVSRLDFPPWRETLLYVAPFARKPWMLPDEARIGVTHDMSLEAIRRVQAARPARSDNPPVS
jgi:hypothetical protein